MDWDEAIDYVMVALQTEGLSPSTIASYEYDWRDIATFTQVSPDQLQKEHIRKYVAHVLKKISPQTINRRLIALRTFYSQLLDAGWVSENPARGVKLMKTQKDKTHATLTESQAEEFINSLGSFRYGTRNAFMGILMMRMGLRIGEVARLNITDVNVEQGYLRVLGKGNKVRRLPLPQDVIEVFEAYMKDRRDIADHGEHALFITREGRRVSVRTINHWMHKSFIELGAYNEKLPNKQRLTPHKLRHTFAVYARRSGADILTLQALLGHENIQTTTIYTDFDEERAAAVMDTHPLRKK